MRPIFALLIILTASLASASEFEVPLAASDFDRENTPVSISLSTEKKPGTPLMIKLPDGTHLPAQLTGPSLLGGDKPRLNFILPKLVKGKGLTLLVTDTNASPAPVFNFKQNPDGQYEDMLLGDRPVLRYMHAKYDPTDKATKYATMKVYHHVFDPEGKRIVTKGETTGQFPHHRGLFYGFNRISYDGKTADTWHCNNGESTTHEKFVSHEAGPVLGRQVMQIDWHGKQNDVFAKETREMTVYNTVGGTLIEFASRLESTGAKIKLDGDPQHAGFQFRASQEVPDKAAKLTYFLRPDGKGEPGKFRNWDPKNTDHKNLPWLALSFVLDGERYTCCYLDRPQNPKESRFSERDYGRFGSYFEAEVEPGKPLELNYRIWLQKGEMTVEEVQKLDDNFVRPLQPAVM